MVRQPSHDGPRNHGWNNAGSSSVFMIVRAGFAGRGFAGALDVALAFRRKTDIAALFLLLGCVGDRVVGSDVIVGVRHRRRLALAGLLADRVQNAPHLRTDPDQFV